TPCHGSGLIDPRLRAMNNIIAPSKLTRYLSGIGADRSSTVRIDDHRFVVGALRARRIVASHSPLQAQSLSPHWRVVCFVSHCAQLSHPPTHWYAERCY